MRSLSLLCAAPISVSLVSPDSAGRQLFVSACCGSPPSSACLAWCSLAKLWRASGLGQTNEQTNSDWMVKINCLQQDRPFVCSSTRSAAVCWSSELNTSGAQHAHNNHPRFITFRLDGLAAAVGANANTTPLDRDSRLSGTPSWLIS